MSCLGRVRNSTWEGSAALALASTDLEEQAWDTGWVTLDLKNKKWSGERTSSN